MTVCDKFQPTILEGQLCYTLDIAKYVGHPTESGKLNGLRLLLDPNPYQIADKHAGGQTFKVFIDTLAQHTTFGAGSYGMSDLKKMTGTTSFEQLPDHQKKCLIHNREECQTQKYLEHVQKECSCVPWALQTKQVKRQFYKKNTLGRRSLLSVAQTMKSVLKTYP